jgi:hypothetical protein
MALLRSFRDGRGAGLNSEHIRGSVDSHKVAERYTLFGRAEGSPPVMNIADLDGSPVS